MGPGVYYLNTIQLSVPIQRVPGSRKTKKITFRQSFTLSSFFLHLYTKREFLLFLPLRGDFRQFTLCN